MFRVSICAHFTLQVVHRRAEEVPNIRTLLIQMLYSFDVARLPIKNIFQCVASGLRATRPNALQPFPFFLQIFVVLFATLERSFAVSYTEVSLDSLLDGPRRCIWFRCWMIRADALHDRHDCAASSEPNV